MSFTHLLKEHFFFLVPCRRGCYRGWGWRESHCPGFSAGPGGILYKGSEEGSPRFLWQGRYVRECGSDPGSEMYAQQCCFLKLSIEPHTYKQFILSVVILVWFLPCFFGSVYFLFFVGYWGSDPWYVLGNCSLYHWAVPATPGFLFCFVLKITKL